MTPSIYINLEDDVSKIVDRIKREASSDIVLVCPKRCFLFNDSINLRLLKKQADLIKKSVSILTMDERGQVYARDAGFALRFLPKNPKSKGMRDIEKSDKPKVKISVAAEEKEKSFEKIKTEAGELKIAEKTSAVSPPLNLDQIKQTAKKLSRADAPEQEPGKKSTAVKPKNSEALPKISVQENIFPFEIEEHYRKKKQKGGRWKWAVGFLLVAVLAAGALVFIILPRAEIVVVPKNDMLDSGPIKISFGTAVKEPDSTKLVLPATRIAEEIELKKTIDSQGKKEVGNRATGFVRIYNFSRSPLNLKAETTTLSLNGKNYTLVNDIAQLRPTAYTNATTKEVDKSTLVEPLEIIATEGGEGYNLPAGTRLEISNKVFGSKPQVLYAKTDSPISGGTSRYLSIVLDRDISSAQEQLKNEALSRVRAKLESQMLFLPDDAYTLQVEQFEADNAPGTQSPNISAKAKIKILGLAIKQDVLKKLVFERLSQRFSGSKTLSTQEGSYEMIVKTDKLENDYQSGTLLVTYRGRVWYNLSASFEGVEKQLRGKTPEEAGRILSQNDETERVDIVVFPSWQKRLPFLQDRIGIQISMKIGP